MPLLTQKFIFRSDLRANPDVLYIFGDNDLRDGLAGQAKEMRGEPNAAGIRTKAAPSMNPASFWSDKTFVENCTKLNEDFRRVFRHVKDSGLGSRIAILPADGLGTGFSQLPERAPATYDYLQSLISRLKAGRYELWHKDEPSDSSIIKPSGL